MALAKNKQLEILEKSKEIESLLINKFKKIDKTLTFGGKVKYSQEYLTNPFLVDCLWNLVKTRNLVAHEGEFKITNKEYQLFLSCYTYIIETF